MSATVFAANIHRSSSQPCKPKPPYVLVKTCNIDDHGKSSYIVWGGHLEDLTGRICTLSEARMIPNISTLNHNWIAGVAVSGLSSRSVASATVDKVVLMQVELVITCSDASVRTIKKLPAS